MSVGVEIEGWAELQRKLGQNFVPVIRSITLKVARQLQRIIGVEPGPRVGPVPWTSMKQKIWYHHARKKAGLPLQYTRNSDPWSQRIKDSWDSRNVGQFDAEVRAGATYAVYVQKDPRLPPPHQQPMHAETGWITDLQAIDKLNRSGDVQNIARDEIEYALRTA